MHPNCVHVVHLKNFILYVAATVNFAHSVYHVNEGSGVVQVALVLSNLLSVDITVEALNTDESATGDLTLISCTYVCTVFAFLLGGVDYSAGPYTVTFAAGTTDALFDVTISDDDVYRGNIYFNITINPSSLPNDVIVGNTDQTRVIILDAHDDSKLITYHFYIAKNLRISALTYC